MTMEISITKRDGTREPFNADKINRSIERACAGLTDPISMVTQIATETRLTLYDGIGTDELDLATINAAIQNIKEDTQYDKVATRLLLKTIYHKVVGDYENSQEVLKKKHRDFFPAWVERGVNEKLLDPRMLEKFDLKELAAAIEISRDDLFIYSGLSTLLHRYSLKSKDEQPAETPQYFFMRVAMGLSYNEKDPTLWAKRFYEKMSRLEYLAGGSTNIGAGTTHPSLSNCYLLQIEDDMQHIAKSVADVIMLSKHSGGIGASVTKLRATGSPLSSNNTPSSGPTPFAKIIDTAIRAVQRGGKKKGALCFYMENWHIDFPEFLDWKKNSGDDYMRMRTADTAVFMTDEFMKRVMNHEMWYMFDPKETPDLIELYGKAFSKRYAEYIEMADAGKLRVFKKVPAEEQYRQILVELQSSSHPWLTWKDPINVRALNNNSGTIHMSNLCTEICLPQDKDNIAVCNLASLNLAAHTHHKQIDWEKLEQSVRFAVRQLDDLIDINDMSIPEATRSDHENRAIGLGIMGFADVLEQLGMAYDSEHAWDFADRIFEFVSYAAIDASADLAAERGSYKNFPGSGWSKGMVPIDTIKLLEANRGEELTVTKGSRYRGLNWDALREKVKKGMRNATLMAVAPNANIGLVAGTTPGIDPRFAQVFSRNKISGKYFDINHNLVNDLKNMGIWEDIREQIIAEQGDLTNIPGIPQHLKDIYKTSFSTSPYAFIEVAARAQKWVDQALSRNMYLETRDIGETMEIYTTAWRKGVKTTYYLHMKPRHTAEQSTVKVNKAEKAGQRGFSAVMNEAPAGIEHEREASIVSAVSDAIGTLVSVSPAPATTAVAETAVAHISPTLNLEFAAPKTAEPVAQTAIADTTKAPFGFSAVMEGTSETMATAAPKEDALTAFAAKMAKGEAGPTASAAKANIIPPSDPQEQFLCDSCQ